MQLESVRASLCGLREMDFFDQEGSCHIKTLPHFSIVQPIRGSYEIQLDDGPVHTARAGELFIAPPQRLQTITHHMDAQRSMRARWVFFDVELNDACSAELMLDFPVIPSKSAIRAFHALLDALFAADDPCDRMSLCYQLVKELLACAQPRQAAVSHDLLRVVEYIKQHYQQKISIRDLAELIHSSESNLYAAFRRQFHTSPIAYLNDYRLSQACKLLKASSASIEAVARAVGIEDARYFAKLFGRRYQLTPTAYRKSILP